MRRTILFSSIALLVVSAANVACAQHHGAARPAFARSGYGFNRARSGSPNEFHYANRPYGMGYAYLPYNSDVAYAPEPAFYADSYPEPYTDQPPQFVPSHAQSTIQTQEHSVITEYKWPTAEPPASLPTSSQAESQTFAIVLKNGSTLSAVSVFTSQDGLHYVDPDDRHLCISMSEVDRAETLKINRARNLNLHLPAAQ
jgi:hypothetical protein